MGLYRRRDRKGKNRIWWISYMEGGKQRRESSGSTNKRLAQLLLTKRKAEALEGRLNLPRSHSPRLGEFSKQFLASIDHEETRSRYKSSINNILRYFGPEVRLADLTPQSAFTYQRKRVE